MTPGVGYTKPVIRASETDRAFSCAGSLTVTRMVDPIDRDDGDEGTMLHWMIADRAIRELGATPPEGGLPPPAVPKGYKLPGNSLWIVSWAIRQIRRLIPDHWSLMVEVEMSHEFDRWINTGHADIIGISPDGTHSIGIDWKSVRVPVDPADNNWQVASYIVLQKKEWPTLVRCEFYIAQPRVVEEDGVERMSHVDVTDLGSLSTALDFAAEWSLDRPMELETGKQCRWCVGCSCPAIQAEQEFMEMTMTPEMLATIKRTPDDATLGDFVLIGRRLEAALKDATEMLHARLDVNPVVVAGGGEQISRKIQRGDYKIPDPTAFFTKLREVLPEESIPLVMTPSMTRIKDEIADKMAIPKTGKAEMTADSVFDAQLRPLVEQGEKRILVVT